MGGVPLYLAIFRHFNQNFENFEKFYKSKELISPTSGQDVVLTHCGEQLPPSAAVPSLGAAKGLHQPTLGPKLQHSEHYVNSYDITNALNVCNPLQIRHSTTYSNKLRIRLKSSSFISLKYEGQ